MFKQGKKHIADFIIEFEVLAMKADIDELYTAFLLKKNVWADIIKTILGYPPIVVSKMLKEWKVEITLVRQGYESMESQPDYRTSTEIISGEQEALIDIEKSKDNFDKDRKSRCFNCSIYEHMAKEY